MQLLGKDMTTQHAVPSSEWPDDALGRKLLADYLTASICAQIKRQKESKKGLTVSLDATWGAGKTFFVKNWAKDLENANHPVVYFDAWENDIGDEASIALISSILNGIDNWKNKIQNKKSLQIKASKLRRRAVSTLRQAIIPIASVILKGAIRKATGSEIDDLITALYEKSKDKSSNVIDEPFDAVDKLLDEAFEKKLELHESRKDYIKDFRSSLHDLLNLIENHTEAKLPLFIFIDELDRCRPSYAVKLLEEIKHIFGIEDVAYVVSTNLSQLQNSVRALYGSDFDGRGYLRRLFDREYTLPRPSNKNFSQSIINNSSAVKNCSAYSGMPNVSDNRSHIENAWSIISDALNLDYRTQKQILALSEEIILTLENRKTIHVLWLFFLCSLSYINKELLESIANHSKPPGHLFKDDFTFLNKNIKIIIQQARRDSYSPTDEISTNLSSVLNTYYSISCMDNEKASNELHNAKTNDYPKCIIWKFSEELGHSNQKSTDHLSIYDYASLVCRAGFVITEDDEQVN
jgi:hypothetical protein